ncbi:DDE-type integrase/transposase/recombinase [Vibrio sp. 1-Bac 57]
MKRSGSGVKNTEISTVTRSERTLATGDTWYLDKVFIKINGVLHYLWRAVDQDGDEIDILFQKQKIRR